MSVKKIVIVLVGLVLVAGAAWFGYARFKTGTLLDSNDFSNGITSTTEPLAPGRPNDADSDGILDADEKTQGLNPAEYDTDGDGLSDKAELEQFKTDPKKSDTDGDTFWDGTEIMKGYNPLGPGRLPTSTKP